MEQGGIAALAAAEVVAFLKWPVGRISDVWDRSKEGSKGGEERRYGGMGHGTSLATVSAKSTLHHFPRAGKKDEAGRKLVYRMH